MKIRPSWHHTLINNFFICGHTTNDRRNDRMDQNNRKQQLPKNASAPGIDEEDAYGKKATPTDIEKDESTTVTRLVYDEYDASKK